MQEPDPRSALNRASYDAIAPHWDAARTGFSGRERAYLDALLDGLSAGAVVLDLGCGTGRPMAEHVVGRGHRIVGVDQSAALLALARSRFPAETWIESRIEDYVPDRRFAAAISWDALFHVPRERHEAILARVTQALAPGGRLMLTAGGSAHPGFTDEMFGARFFYDSHAPDDTRALLRRLGLRVLIDEFMNLPDGGRDKGRLAFVAQKEDRA